MGFDIYVITNITITLSGVNSPCNGDSATLLPLVLLPCSPLPNIKKIIFAPNKNRVLFNTCDRSMNW